MNEELLNLITAINMYPKADYYVNIDSSTCEVIIRKNYTDILTLIGHTNIDNEHVKKTFNMLPPTKSIESGVKLFAIYNSLLEYTRLLKFNLR